VAELIQIGVNGAAGRMGQRIVALAHEDPLLQVAVALERADHPRLGDDVGEICALPKLGVPLEPELRRELDCLIDFSLPDGAVAVAEACRKWKTPLVMATTGLSDEQRRQVLGCAHEIALLLAPNMSLAMNVLMKLLREAAQALKDPSRVVDVEVVECHHRFKEDAPSGTALALGRIVAEQMGQTEHVHGRHGRPGPRPRYEIGYHALRTGDNVGQHTVFFGLMGETLELTHRAHTRDCYARGALAAAKFLVGKPAGTYSMNDVLGL
jgi:4-hydroxy-tetrahydrodipicolinate reductase